MKEKKINKYHIRDEDKNTLFERTDTKIWLWANYIVIFFILLSVVILWLVTIEDIKIEYSTEIFITDFIISIVFLIEYIYRWKNSNDKIKFPFRFMHILDLLSFLPFFILIWLYWVWTYSVFILFRIFRIIRIFELIERIPIIAKILSWINKHKIEYLAAIVSITITIVIFSTITYYSEYYWWNAQMFSSLPQTFWWAIVTMTNTWYWDIIPITFIWKIIAILLMFLWPILVTILASITVIIFIESTQIINMWSYKNNKCPKCWKKNEQDAVYCKKCWKKLKKEK
jgi:voltage-gated potassium channel